VKVRCGGKAIGVADPHALRLMLMILLFEVFGDAIGNGCLDVAAARVLVASERAATRRIGSMSPTVQCGH